METLRYFLGCSEFHTNAPARGCALVAFQNHPKRKIAGEKPVASRVPFTSESLHVHELRLAQIKTWPFCNTTCLDSLVFRCLRLISRRLYIAVGLSSGTTGCLMPFDETLPLDHQLLVHSCRSFTGRPSIIVWLRQCSSPEADSSEIYRMFTSRRLSTGHLSSRVPLI